MRNNYWEVITQHWPSLPDDYDGIPWLTAHGGTADSWLGFRGYRFFQGQGAGHQAICEVRVRA